MKCCDQANLAQGASSTLPELCYASQEGLVVEVALPVAVEEVAVVVQEAEDCGLHT